MRALSRRFYARRADVVAQALLGKTLRCGDRTGLIVVTEAYFGGEDRASHARFGETDRNRPMFGPAGFAYVYLCYGVHELFNVVTGTDQVPQAVLIRALEPGNGVPASPKTTRGPGKLTRARGISRAHNGLDITASNDLSVTPGRRVSKGAICSGPRIGVDYAGTWARKPLCFWIANHPSVSA